MSWSAERPRGTKHSVCIVVPVCNEAESLARLGDKLEELHRTLQSRFAVEYCFVNDGSTDETAEMLERLVLPGRKQVLSHPSRRGVGAAFRTGFAHVHADIVCTIDADMSYPPAALAGMLDALARDEADIVVASPYHPLGRVDGVEPWRLALSRCCSSLYTVATPLRLYTYTSIFRAYKGPLVRELVFPSDGFVAAVEILLSAARMGGRVTEAPATLSRRAAGYSKMRIARTVWSHAKLLALCCARRDERGFPRLGASARAAGADTVSSSRVPVRLAAVGGKEKP